jgi:RNA-directed DNA polymerase
MRERPVHCRPRRLADWINPTGVKKVHSLIDKVYQRKNLERAWEKVKANRGSGGVDGQNLEAFAAHSEQQLERVAERAERRYLSTATGAAGADPEGRQAG